MFEGKGEDHDGSESTTTTSSSKISWGLRESLFAIGVYLLIGGISYHSTLAAELRQSSPTTDYWSWIDALYFSVVTFTTVGYGDLVPTSGLGKAFTVVFGLAGISILGLAISAIGSKLMTVESDMIEKAKQTSRRNMLRFWHDVSKEDGRKGGKAKEATKDSSATNYDVSLSDYEPKEERLWQHTLRSLVQKLIPSFVVLLLGGIGMGRLEGWSLTDSAYYAFVTASTIGYGDLSPVTRLGRLLGIAFIPVAVAAVGEVLGSVATTLQERRQEQFYKSLLEKEKLNPQRLLQMDTDRNGRVSREEYVQFMLQEMDLVSAEEFDELHAQFDKLDIDGGGYLDKADIQVRVDKQNRVSNK